MKWFKHDSDASNDAKLKKLRLKYGAQGYGIYWYCLELIARNVEKHNLTFELEHDAELIADDFKLSSDLVQHIMTYMVELELFEDIDGVISCLKMATRADEYTQQILRDSRRYQLSRECPESVPRISEVREEKRREEIKYIPPIPEELFEEWQAIRGKKKPVTERAFKAIVREAEKIDWTPEQAIIRCCERGWAGFDASWVEKEKPKKDSLQDMIDRAL
jgi:hypothetical protein